VTEAAAPRALSGELTFDTVPAVWRELAGWLNGGSGDVALDLAKVTHADSAGLALLIELQRVAKRRQRKLRLLGVPEQLADLIRINDLTDAFATK
jgi:phospholipid transport system transporter-binding protein